MDCDFVFLTVEGRCRRGSCLSYWPARRENKAVCDLQFCEKSDMTESLCLCWRSATLHPGLSDAIPTMLEDWRLLSETFSSPVGMLSRLILITLRSSQHTDTFKQNYTFHYIIFIISEISKTSKSDILFHMYIFVLPIT